MRFTISLLYYNELYELNFIVSDFLVDIQSIQEKRELSFYVIII
jgi:hypothetical protein